MRASSCGFLDWDRILVVALLVAVPLGGVCCGMDMVATGDSQDAGTSADALEAGTTSDADAAARADAGGDGGDASATCHHRGAPCTKTTDCCSGLSCKPMDEGMTCQP